MAEAASASQVEQETVLHVPARDVPVPTSISPEAAAVLAAGIRGMPSSVGGGISYPAHDDHDGWRALIDTVDAGLLALLEAGAQGLDVTVEDVVVDGVRVYIATPATLSPDARARVNLEIHGGGFYHLGGDCCRAYAVMKAASLGVTAWAVDYRMPPDHPYPAALDDCVTVYRALVHDHRPEEIVVSGASAGGNLAAALILRARDEGLPLPAAAVLQTPEADLTESGDSFATNLGVDTVLTGSLGAAIRLYADGHDLTDPYLSPLYGDFNAGFPPTFLQTGTRDLFLSNTVRMHRALRAADVAAELHVFEAMNHGGFRASPEAAELDREIRRFLSEHWA